MTPPTRLAGLTLLKLGEVKERTGLSTKTLRKYLLAGDLKGRKVGGLWWVTAEALKEFGRKLPKPLSQSRSSQPGKSKGKKR